VAAGSRLGFPPFSIKNMPSPLKTSRVAYRDRSSYDRCRSCQSTRKAAYQRTYRAFRARAKAQGGQCPICKTSYDFSGRPLDYRRPCTTKAGDMICNRCATLLGLVGDDGQTLLAAGPISLRSYEETMRRGFFRLWVVISLLWIGLGNFSWRKKLLVNS
jgi:hypothetical protein